MSGELPRLIETGKWSGGHIQGIAVDLARGWIYCSFTTRLVKLDLAGRVLGSVCGLLGHLGCLAFCQADGQVYGSLEFKQDAIGQAILKQSGSRQKLETGFYVAIFAGDKINRLDMDAYQDGIMTSVWLEEVVADHTGSWQQEGRLMRFNHACSGIDGISFGPDFGADSGSKPYLHVAYGIYGDSSRSDNDYQVLIQYDASNWPELARPLSRQAMHKSGPLKPRRKYFLFTGNTSWGVQNLEYDAFTGNWLLAVYRGAKPHFPNFDLYLADGAVAARQMKLLGDPAGRSGAVLALAQGGCLDSATGISGWYYPYGSTGMQSLGDGLFYLARPYSEAGLHSAKIALYRWTGQVEEPFTEVAAL